MLTETEKEKINRTVNGNFMVSLIKVLQEDLEYFRGQYSGNEKNAFKRILTNCENIFNTNNMNEHEKKELETISDAMIDAIYDLRVQYRTHVENEYIKIKGNQ